MYPATVIRNIIPGRASPLAAFLFGQICPIFSLVVPCQPGASLQDLRHKLLLQDTSASGVYRDIQHDVLMAKMLSPRTDSDPNRWPTRRVTR